MTMTRIITIKDDNPQFEKILAVAHEAGCKIWGTCEECIYTIKGEIPYDFISLCPFSSKQVNADTSCNLWKQKP